ncbi:MAG: hypothetical protein JWM74_2985, partial [Myxococcaceae bacterium]|nr:hypothetical protein [Myxococcaceae bacterium]
MGNVGVWAASIGAQSGAIALLGLGNYLFGPPIVHMAHGHDGKAVGDFGLRLGLPTLLGLFGFAVGGDS